MKIEFSVCDLDDFLLGIISCVGEDEDGPFKMVSVGILFFQVDFITYI